VVAATVLDLHNDLGRFHRMIPMFLPVPSSTEAGASRRHSIHLRSRMRPSFEAGGLYIRLIR
jgi:hypothetical protein